MRLRRMMAGIMAGMLLRSLALAQTGVFRSAYEDSVGVSATGIAVGDFNRDGAADVAVCTAGSGGNELDIFVGLRTCVGGARPVRRVFRPLLPGRDVSGAANRPPPAPAQRRPSALLQANFDEDAFDDLIIARQRQRGGVLEGPRQRQKFFDPPGDPFTVGQSPAGLATATSTATGTRDLVVAIKGVTHPGSITCCSAMVTARSRHSGSPIRQPRRERRQSARRLDTARRRHRQH